MKLKNILWLAVTFLFALNLVGCNKDDTDLYSGDYVLRSQAEVDAYNVAGNVNSLIINGEDITDISSLKLAACATVIITKTGIVDLVMPCMTSNGVRFEISENAQLESISKLGLKFMTGDMYIQGNPKLMNLAGLFSLKTMSGKMYIMGNSVLGEDKGDAPDTWGFNVLKTLISNQVIKASNISISNNHPKAATDPTQIGQSGGDGPYSYLIKSDADAAAFTPKNGLVQNLTVQGAAVTNEGWSQLGNKIKTVKGAITVDGASITTSENFFEKVDCQGSIVLKNLTGFELSGPNKFFNSNGFKNTKHIYGDFILENIPYLIHWGAGNCLANIQEVEGSLTVRNCGMQQLAFKSLKRVGGNVDISENSLELYTGFFWNMLTGPLTYIGGDFTYTNNNHVNGLGGFEGVQYIGGNITITGNGTDPAAGDGIPYASISGQVGFQLVADWINKDVVSRDATFVLKYADGTDVKLSVNPAKKSYTLTGRNELVAFTNHTGDKETIVNLTILGNGENINDDDLSKVKARVAKVEGTFTIDGINGLTSSEQFFPDIVVDGGIIFKNCPELWNMNGFKLMTAIGGDLVFENCPKLVTEWGVGTCLSQIVSIAGDLQIIGDNANLAGIAFRSLKRVDGDFIVERNNGNFWNFGGDNGLTINTIGGNLIIKDNINFNGLAGFDQLTSIGGNVTITKNGTNSGGIPYEDTSNQIGFRLVADWLASGVVKQQATLTLQYADGSNVVLVAKPKNYNIVGRDALLAFAPQDNSATKETVENLTINGNGDAITDHDMSFVKTRVSKVKGTLTIIGISGLSTTEHLFPDMVVEGGIVFKNCPELGNTNGMKGYTAIGGDLIFENCPKLIVTWPVGNCLTSIERVAGNLKLIGVMEPMTGLVFHALKHVGGDFIVEGNNGNFWNFNDGMKIETVGGNLIIRNNLNYNGLGGLEKLKNVGGNLIIAGNGANAGGIPVKSAENQVGLELLGTLYKAKVFSTTATFTIESNGTNYTITEL